MKRIKNNVLAIGVTSILFAIAFTIITFAFRGRNADAIHVIDTIVSVVPKNN